MTPHRSLFALSRRSLLLHCLSVLCVLLGLGGVLMTPRSAYAATFTVNLSSDLADANTGDGLCDVDLATAGQQCTLRAAIQQSNATSTADLITFAIPGAGVPRIQPTSPLPGITSPVTIDGATQSAGLVELDGSLTNSSCLYLPAGGSTIRRLVINRCGGAGIFISGAGGNRISGNRIGTDVTGTSALPNVQGIHIDNAATNTIGGTAAGEGNLISGNLLAGILLPASATGTQIQGNLIGTDVNGMIPLPNTNGIALGASSINNTIGGTAAGAGNLISGNTQNGIFLQGGAASNQIQGNLIGTNMNGSADLGNGAYGIYLNNGAATNTIGGTAAGTRNLISGNNQGGIALLSGATSNQIQGNFIGTDLTGSTGVPNSGSGIYIEEAAATNTIGGMTPGSGNRIAFNTGRGVFILGSGATGNRISGNQIYANDQLGIDLGGNGVTPNDPGDGDTGPNRFQNYPVLSIATVNAGITAVAGTLSSTLNTSFSLEFFSNTACDPSGAGEGQAVLGSFMVTTNAAGTATFATSFNAPAPPGSRITATATDPAGNTSEFSACATAGGPPSMSIADTSVTEDNAAVTATMTVSLSAPSAQTITVNYATSNGTAIAPADYISASGTLTFAPGETSKPITIIVQGDLLDEPTETFTVTLSNPGNATISDTTATGTILDNDPAPSLSSADASVTEGNTGVVTATVTVSLSAASGQTITVNYATSNGTATAPADYTTTSGILTFTAGQTTRTISVPVRGDLLDEPNETFIITLSSPSNATISDTTATGTILDDDYATYLPMIVRN